MRLPRINYYIICCVLVSTLSASNEPFKLVDYNLQVSNDNEAALSIVWTGKGVPRGIMILELYMDEILAEMYPIWNSEEGKFLAMQKGNKVVGIPFFIREKMQRIDEDEWVKWSQVKHTDPRKRPPIYVRIPQKSSEEFTYIALFTVEGMLSNLVQIKPDS